MLYDAPRRELRRGASHNIGLATIGARVKMSSREVSNPNFLFGGKMMNGSFSTLLAVLVCCVCNSWDVDHRIDDRMADQLREFEFMKDRDNNGIDLMYHPRLPNANPPAVKVKGTITQVFRDKYDADGLLL